MIKFEDDEVQATYEMYMKELEEVKKTLGEVGTPYAMLAWWYTIEYDTKWNMWYSRYEMLDWVRLAAIIENEVEMILHKHFADDVIAEYRKMFAQDGLIRLEHAMTDEDDGY